MIACMASLQLTAQEYGNKVVLSNGFYFTSFPATVDLPSNNYSSLEWDQRLGLTPRIAYQTKKWAAGVLFDYQKSKGQLRFGSSWWPSPWDIWRSSWYVFEAEVESRQTAFGAFAQYLPINREKLQVFVEYDGRFGKIRNDTDYDQVFNLTRMSKESDVFSTGIHLGGRYQLVKGLGVELRLQRLLSYTSVKGDNDMFSSEQSEFRLFDEVWKDVAVGLSYSF